MNQDQIQYSDGYAKVINLAKCYAAGTSGRVMRVKHLLAAFLDAGGDVFREILGVTNLVRPAYLSFKPKDKKGETFLSSQVNRILSLHGGRMDEISSALGIVPEIGLAHLAAAMLTKPCGPVRELIDMNGMSSGDASYTDAIMMRARRIVNEEFHANCDKEKLARINKLRKVKSELCEVCHGQDRAVEELVAHVASAMVVPPSERGFRPISISFLGSTGTGKSMMATAFRDAWAREFGAGKPEIIDMSRYSVEQLVTGMRGTDLNWKSGNEGDVTGEATKFPRGVLIFERLESAHPGALVEIANMLETGKMLDEFTKREISFANNIIILITNQGASYIESGKFAQLCSRNGGTIPREKLVEGITAGIEAEMPEKAGILAEILKKVDVPILFKRHNVHSMCAIIGDAVDRALAQAKSIFEVAIEADREKLVAFFLETLQNLDSAHGIASAVESVIITRLERELLDAPDLANANGSHISIVVGDLPALDIPDASDDDDAMTSLEKRTHARIRQARQLEYDITSRCPSLQKEPHCTSQTSATSSCLQSKTPNGSAFVPQTLCRRIWWGWNAHGHASESSLQASATARPRDSNQQTTFSFTASQVAARPLSHGPWPRLSIGASSA